MRNPFVGFAIGAWAVFLAVSLAVDFKEGAWVVWSVWLTLVTVAPIAWWWKHREDWE